ncbi:MAG: hypothetical protein ACRDD1_19660, partial [Planctomycetia bacterium]
FSADAKAAKYGAAAFRPYSGLTSTLLLNFVERYEAEGKDVVGKELLEMHRETVRRVLSKASLEERLAGVPVEQILAHVPAEQRLAGLSDDDLRNLSPEVREALLRRLLGPSNLPSS